MMTEFLTECTNITFSRVHSIGVHLKVMCLCVGGVFESSIWHLFGVQMRFRLVIGLREIAKHFDSLKNLASQL